MAARRAARRPKLRACLRCGALSPYESSSCRACGSPDLTEEWSGMIIILDEDSYVARVTGLKPGLYAIKVAGKVVVRP